MASPKEASNEFLEKVIDKEDAFYFRLQSYTQQLYLRYGYVSPYLVLEPEVGEVSMIV